MCDNSNFSEEFTVRSAAVNLEPRSAFQCFLPYNVLSLGQAMGQVVNRRFITTGARVQAQGSRCGICDGQSGIEIVSLRASITSSLPHIHSCIITGMDTGPIKTINKYVFSYTLQLAHPA
jgi:hypothetical protein